MNPTVAKLWTCSIAVLLVYAAYLFYTLNPTIAGALLIAAGALGGWELLPRTGDVKLSDVVSLEQKDGLPALIGGEISREKADAPESH